jgi:hypothetical protein
LRTRSDVDFLGLDGLAEVLDPAPDAISELGQFPRPEDDQDDHEDDQQLCES